MDDRKQKKRMEGDGGRKGGGGPRVQKWTSLKTIK